jgi:hypothetical protein
MGPTVDSRKSGEANDWSGAAPEFGTLSVGQRSASARSVSSVSTDVRWGHVGGCLVSRGKRSQLGSTQHMRMRDASRFFAQKLFDQPAHEESDCEL